MLIKAKALKGCKLESIDGTIGKVDEFYFDDNFWTIRYLVADTGDWLMDRKVLISPYSLAAAKMEERLLPVELTKKQIEDSPPLGTDKPVSRQFEEDYYGHFGWPMYWSGPHPWGPYPHLERDPGRRNESRRSGKAWDAHLRSTREVGGYGVQASDGEIGHVEDFVIDDETWAIRYLIIDTRNWWPGKKILISPRWIERVSWGESKVFVKLARDAVKRSPEYSESSLVSRDYETSLHHHYDQEGYWGEETAAKKHHQ